MLNSRNIRIAIIDDDEDDYFIIAECLKEIEGSQFTIDWCSNYDTALKKIRNREHDIYFVDYRLGNHTGLDLLKEACTEDFYDPVVLLTGKGNKDIDVKAMQYGATDYLIKSELNAEKLERCIRYSLDRADDLKELKARENKYRNLFENSKDAIFIADKDLVLQEVNHAASVLFATGDQKPVNRSLHDFMKNETQKKKFVDLFRNQDNISDLELDIESSNGEVKHCILSLSFIQETGGEHFIHGILHDITNIKKVEAANLQSQRLAANERLMRTLAHEIRNPLNNIGLSLENLLLSGDEESQKDLIPIMQRNCNRINQIITELLNLTRPQELVFQSCSLQEILDESVAMCSDRINLQKVEVQKKYPSDPLTIPANKSKLIIAFTNILINAVEATVNGNGKLLLTAEESPGGYTVVIKDNGKGIPDEYLPKLFEPFFTLKKNGIGLGLATSYSILQSHKAGINVQSEIDKGTTFTISFGKKRHFAEAASN